MSGNIEKYMVARMHLESALTEFHSAAQSVGYTQESIAGNILDIVYDVNSDLYRAVQEESLPMVEKFAGTKSLNYEEVKSDWQRIMTLWEQNQMWKALNK